MTDDGSLNLADLTFLVVDDSPIIHTLLKRFLGEMECQSVFTALSGKKAMEILADNQVDFIICDWNMPGMKGIEVLKKTRALSGHEQTPFLMLTAEANKEYIIEAVRGGVSGYLIKPFKPDHLRDKIAVILDRG